MKADRSFDCERFLREAWLVKSGEIDPGARAWWESHRASCADCHRALDESETALAAYDEAARTVLGDDDFTGIVHRARRGVDRATSRHDLERRRWPIGRYALGVAAGVALFAIGMTIGRATRPGPGPEELEALRVEVRQVRAEAAMASLERPSASERIHGVMLVSRMDRPEPRLLDAVVGVLERDPSPNVRLAAVDALHAVADLGPVRERLLAALHTDPSPAIRIALIDLLVHRRLEGGREALERLQGEAEDPAVRERAAWARGALS